QPAPGIAAYQEVAGGQVGGRLGTGFLPLIDKGGSIDLYGSNSISAWTAATETGFTSAIPWSPRLGLRADVASGSQHTSGGTLGTFNPLFPRGAYFGPKLSMFGPFNIMDAHPFVMFSPLPSISCDLDSGWFWRESLNDGLYQIGGALLRPSGRSTARYIG